MKNVEETDIEHKGQTDTGSMDTGLEYRRAYGQDILYHGQIRIRKGYGI